MTTIHWKQEYGDIASTLFWVWDTTEGGGVCEGISPSHDGDFL